MNLKKPKYFIKQKMKICITLMKLNLELIVQKNKKLSYKKKKLILFWKIQKIEILSFYLLKYIGRDRLVITNMIIYNSKIHLKKIFFDNDFDI